MNTRTSKADKNYYSISQNILQMFAGTELAMTVGQIPARLDNVQTGLVLRDERPWDSLLKLSNSERLRFNDIAIGQGMENAVDCNDGARECVIDASFGAGGGTGDQVITVKGGCERLVFSGTIHSTGRNADVVVGAWSDQSHEISRDLDYYNLRREDGEPVTFILARCKNVRLPRGAKVLRLKSMGYSLYWWAKFAAVKLGFFNKT